MAQKWTSILQEHNTISVHEIAQAQGLAESRINQILHLTTLEPTIQDFLKKLSDPSEIRRYSENCGNLFPSIMNNKS